jgi:hypothetical protein
MKTKFSAIMLIFIISVSGCASTGSATDSSADRTCFNIREIKNWSSIDNKHLYVEGIGSDNNYLFTMFSSCYGIRSAQVIALSNQMSRICSNDFGKVTYKDGGRRMSCNIKTVQQVADKEDAEGIVEAKGDSK